MCPGSHPFHLLQATTIPSFFRVKFFVFLLDLSYQYINFDPLKRNKQYSLTLVTSTNCHTGLCSKSSKGCLYSLSMSCCQPSPLHPLQLFRSSLASWKLLVQSIHDPTLLNPGDSFPSSSSWPTSSIWPGSSLPTPRCSFFPWHRSHLSTCFLLSVSCWSPPSVASPAFSKLWLLGCPRVQSPNFFCLSVHMTVEVSSCVSVGCNVLSLIAPTDCLPQTRTPVEAACLKPWANV